MKKYRAIFRGIIGYLPSVLDVLKDRRESTGSISARYCYSVWLRHLVQIYNNSDQFQIPKIVAEIGPGASLGVGLAALISGSEKYYAFDMILHADRDRNIKVFHELIELFRNRVSIPDEKEFPSIKPVLEEYCFPEKIFTNQQFDEMLNSSRLEKIVKSIENLNKKSNNFKLIEYYVPWDNESIIKMNSVDLIISQAVMEHVIDLEKTYLAMNSWLKIGGIISHQIDFKAHETSDQWFGHRLYSDIIWKIIMKGRSYPINRSPYKVHSAIIGKNEFDIMTEVKIKNEIPFKQVKFNKEFRKFSKDDLSVSAAYILARKLR